MPEIDVQVRHDDGGTLFYYTEVLTLTRWGSTVERRYFTLDSEGKAIPYTPSNTLWSGDIRAKSPYFLMSAYPTERIEDPF